MSDLMREAAYLRSLADGEHAAAVQRAREQFAVAKDTIDREFDKVFDDARDAGFVTLDEIKRLRDRPRPSYAEIEAKRDAAIAHADEILNRAIGRIFDRKP
jgi:hypothetical protein